MATHSIVLSIIIRRFDFMPLVDSKAMFKKAYEGHYAVGGFQCQQHGDYSGNRRGGD